MHNSKLTKWVTKNPIEAGLGFLAAGFVLSNWGGILKAIDRNAAMREISTAQQSQINLLQLGQDNAKERAKIAEQRFADGCLFVVADGTTQATTLSEGQPVIDAARKAPLPAGSVVCGADGTTGLIKASQDGKPVVTDIAFTGNREVIKAAMQKARFDSRTLTPRMN